MTAPDVAVMPGVCLNDEAAIGEMMRLTHDALIEMTGARCRGPIRWHHCYGADGLRALLALYADDDRPLVAAGLDQFRAFFDEHGADAVLIVASCPAAPPDGAA